MTNRGRNKDGNHAVMRCMARSREYLFLEGRLMRLCTIDWSPENGGNSSA
jgi:hypothetical protein